MKKKTLACLLAMLALLPVAASASGGASAPAEMKALFDADLHAVEGGLTERQFGCGLAVAGLVVATATLGPGMLVAVGWSLSFHGALFACI